MKKKTPQPHKKSKPASPNTPPLHIVLPSTIKEKMDAIVALSHAVEKLAVALSSTHLQATISHCSFVGGSAPSLSLG